jgi:hypothetical protein
MTTAIATTRPTVPASDESNSSPVDNDPSKLFASEADFLRAEVKRILAEGEAELDRLDAIEKASRQPQP